MLDAGCGVGHVALHMVKVYVWHITGIDIIDHHIAKAARNIARSGVLKSAFTVQKMNYRHLESLPEESFDGAYTMETFVHATDPEAVLAGFYRIHARVVASPCSNTATRRSTRPRPRSWSPRCAQSTAGVQCRPTIVPRRASSRR